LLSVQVCSRECRGGLLVFVNYDFKHIRAALEKLSTYDTQGIAVHTRRVLTEARLRAGGGE
jgi:hypothetical protein